MSKRSLLGKDREALHKLLIDLHAFMNTVNGPLVKIAETLKRVGYSDATVMPIFDAINELTAKLPASLHKGIEAGKRWRVEIAKVRKEERERYNEQFDEFCDELQAKSEAKDLARQHEVAKLTKQLTGAKERIVDLQERLDVLKLASARRTAELLAASEFI